MLPHVSPQNAAGMLQDLHLEVKRRQSTATGFARVICQFPSHAVVSALLGSFLFQVSTALSQLTMLTARHYTSMKKSVDTGVAAFGTVVWSVA